MLRIRIDEEFRSLIPPLSAEEHDQLEANIKAHGCQDALKVWDGLLLDGHNRYDICQKHGIQFRVVGMEFANRNEALMWIIHNQFGRRNLTAFARAELALKLEPMIAAQATPVAQRRWGKTASDQKRSRGQSGNRTDKKLAEVAGVSHAQIHKARTIAARAPEPVKADLRAGKTTICPAHTRRVFTTPKLATTPKNRMTAASSTPATWTTRMSIRMRRA